MTTTAWAISGKYFETCSCDFICPCITHQMAIRPSKGICTFAMGFQIERGFYGSISLDGLGFIVLGQTPEEMIKGNWSVGLIADDRASDDQRNAIAAITSGTEGGPMAVLGGLVSKFLGVEPAPIRFEQDGANWSVTAAKLVNIAAAPAMGLDPNAKEPLYLDNTGHPANTRVALAHALRSHVHSLGLDWDDASGGNSGQYAPFSWRNA